MVRLQGLIVIIGRGLINIITNRGVIIIGCKVFTARKGAVQMLLAVRIQVVDVLIRLISRVVLTHKSLNETLSSDRVHLTTLHMVVVYGAHTLLHTVRQAHFVFGHHGCRLSCRRVVRTSFKFFFFKIF